MRPGEKLIDKLDSIEDTKGNNGDRGKQYSFLQPGKFNCIYSITLSDKCLGSCL